MDILNIEKFHQGLILSADTQDIPEDAASASTSIDGDASEGMLMGIPDATTKSASLGLSAQTSAFISRSNGKYDIIYYNPSGHTIVAMTDFYGTAAETTMASSITAGATASMVVQNEAVHIGLGDSGTAATEPVWVGYINHGQFGGDAPGLTKEPLALACPVGGTSGNYNITASSVAGAGGVFFSSSKRIRYAISFEYDGFQESPIFHETSQLPTGTPEYMQIVVTAYGTPVHKRISAINIYRADSPDAAEANLGYARLVKRIDMNDGGWVEGASDYTFTFNDYGTIGVSYEGATGISETLTTTYSLWYGVSCAINGFHIVGDCYHNAHEDASHMLFRSKLSCYDMFDWSNDFVRLPFVPKALAAFNGRVYAFDTNRYARINPDSLIIEEIYEGAGCAGQQSVTVTEKGMFFANCQNIWLHDGREPAPIGNYIRKSDSGVMSWQSQFTTNAKPYVINNTARNSILFVVDGQAHGSETADIWMYHLGRERWDYASHAGVFVGAFPGKDGEVYLSGDVALVRLFGSGTRCAWSYTTKELTMDDGTQNKALYKIQTTGTGTPTVEYSLNGGSFVTAIAGAIPLVNMYGKTLRVRLSGAGTVMVKSMSVIYRKLIGKR